MKKVKFKKAGKWAGAHSYDPQFQVEAGEVVELSDETADMVLEAKAGTEVKKKKPTPAEKDKDAAESGGAE